MHQEQVILSVVLVIAISIMQNCWFAAENVGM